MQIDFVSYNGNLRGEEHLQLTGKEGKELNAKNPVPS